MNKSELFEKDTEAFVTGVEKLVADKTAGVRDAELCDVCLQWTAEGPDCYREGICDEEPKE